jgi:hypothetical protein
MEIKRVGSHPSGKGPADYFTGAVRVDMLFEDTDPTREVGASFTFSPGLVLRGTYASPGKP